jgi:hypothetical protein
MESFIVASTMLPGVLSSLVMYGLPGTGYAKNLEGEYCFYLNYSVLPLHLFCPETYWEPFIK